MLKVLNAYISKGGMIQVSKMMVNEAIEDFRACAKKGFEKLNQLEAHSMGTVKPTIEDVVNEMRACLKDEHQFLHYSWRVFSPNMPVDVPDSPETDLDDFLTDPCWSRFELISVFHDKYYIQGVTFELCEPEHFAELFKSFLQETISDWSEFSEDVFYQAFKNMVELDFWKDLEVRNIQVEDGFLCDYY